jgi:hypothetical protein
MNWSLVYLIALGLAVWFVYAAVGQYLDAALGLITTLEALA